MNVLKRFPNHRSRVRDQGGQGLTEYLTLLVLIAIVSIGAAQSLGKKVKEKIKTATDHINSDITFQDAQ